MGIIMGHLTVQYEYLRIQLGIEKISDNAALIIYGICWILYLIAFIVMAKQYFWTVGTYKVSLDTLLFLQTLAITAFKTFIALMWAYYTPPNNLILVICMMLDILEPGYHPYLYLAFNK